jgi:hypothetical protein
VSEAVQIRPGALHPDVEHSERVVGGGHLNESALALRKAWAIYLILALLPPLAMIMTIFWLLLEPHAWYQPLISKQSNVVGWISFLAGMVWLGLSVPVGFILRGRFWSDYYEGKLVSAPDYLKGNLAVWIPLVIAGVTGFAGLAGTHYVANLLTSLTAFVVFLALHPTGHAMTRPVGDHDDPGVYEEPF